MAVKVRISYEEPQELQRVAELLKPIAKSCKAEKGGKGPYRRAYIECEIVRKDENKPLI